MKNKTLVSLITSIALSSCATTTALEEQHRPIQLYPVRNCDGSIYFSYFPQFYQRCTPNLILPEPPQPIIETIQRPKPILFYPQYTPIKPTIPNPSIPQGNSTMYVPNPYNQILPR